MVVHGVAIKFDLSKCGSSELRTPRMMDIPIANFLGQLQFHCCSFCCWFYRHPEQLPLCPTTSRNGRGTERERPTLNLQLPLHLYNLYNAAENWCTERDYSLHPLCQGNLSHEITCQDSLLGLRTCHVPFLAYHLGGFPPFTSMGLVSLGHKYHWENRNSQRSSEQLAPRIQPAGSKISKACLAWLR